MAARKNRLGSFLLPQRLRLERDAIPQGGNHIINIISYLLQNSIKKNNTLRLLPGQVRHPFAVSQQLRHCIYQHITIKPANIVFVISVVKFLKT